MESYRPISLLPITSKLFEKLLQIRLITILENKEAIATHQFGFRPLHSMVEQIHRVVDKITETFENKQYCSAAFLDITQAFDKVWHTGLLAKPRPIPPPNYFLLLKSYLQNRHFLVKVGTEQTNLHEINAGVPQGSVVICPCAWRYCFDKPAMP